MGSRDKKVKDVTLINTGTDYTILKTDYKSAMRYNIILNKCYKMHSYQARCSEE